MSGWDKFIKIWSGDYTAEGIDYGVKDRQEGKRKLGGIKFFKASNPINWIWNYNRAYDSFVKGYNEGYVAGGLALNGIYDGSLKDSKIKQEVKNMANGVRSYEDAISVLRSMKHYMKSTLGELGVIKDKYDTLINEADKNGWMQNYINELRKRYTRFEDQIEGLKKLIEVFNSQIAEDIDMLEILKQAAEKH